MQSKIIQSAPGILRQRMSAALFSVLPFIVACLPLITGCRHDEPEMIPGGAADATSSDHRPSGSVAGGDEENEDSNQEAYPEIGEGTEDSPANVGWLLNRPDAAGTEVWIEGCVAGYVGGNGFADTTPFGERVVYSLPDPASLYDGSHIVIADPVDEENGAYPTPLLPSERAAIPVVLVGEYARLWNLRDNPEHFGIKVRIRSVAAPVYGRIGLADPTLLLRLSAD